MNHLIIEKLPYNYKIKQDNYIAIKYIGYTLKQAIKEYRTTTRQRYKRFTYIYI